MNKKQIVKITSLISGLFLLGMGAFAQGLTNTGYSADTGVVIYGAAGIVKQTKSANPDNSKEAQGEMGEFKGQDTLPISSTDLLDCEGPSYVQHANNMHFLLDACSSSDACPFKTLDVLTLDQKGVTINTQFVSPFCAWVAATTINGRTYQNGPLYVNGQARISGGLSVMGNTAVYGDFEVYDQTGNKLLKADATNGTLFAHDIIVQAANFPDYVFSPDFVLPTISALRKSVESEHHLPCLNPAQYYETEGLSLYQFNKQLVEQVEILAMYILQQDKELSEMKLVLNDLSK